MGEARRQWLRRTPESQRMSPYTVAGSQGLRRYLPVSQFSEEERRQYQSGWGRHLRRWSLRRPAHQTRVIGMQSELAPAVTRSWQAGRAVEAESPRTLNKHELRKEE